MNYPVMKYSVTITKRGTIFFRVKGIGMVVPESTQDAGHEKKNEHAAVQEKKLFQKEAGVREIYLRSEFRQ